MLFISVVRVGIVTLGFCGEWDDDNSSSIPVYLGHAESSIACKRYVHVG